jgi:hypothetical protein
MRGPKEVSMSYNLVLPLAVGAPSFAPIAALSSLPRLAMAAEGSAAPYGRKHQAALHAPGNAGEVTKR